MRKSRFTDAQLIWMIKEQDAGLPTPAASWPCGDMNCSGFAGGSNS